MIGSTLARAKDAALAKALLILLRPWLSRYGQLEELTLDTRERRLSGVIRLQGDPEALVISEARYEIRKQGEEAWLLFHDVKASREWLQNLLNDHLHRMPLKLPGMARRWLE